MPATLAAALAAAVPLHIADAVTLTPEQRVEAAKLDGQFIAEHGDDILYRSRTRGASAAAFNALARGLALAAYQPGGVTFAGFHWCTDHGLCERAREAACSATTEG